MLQFIAATSDRYTIAEQAQMAIEGGCKWVILRVPDLSDAEVREIAQDLVPLCKETATILTIEDRVELARDLGLHGVWLSKGSASPRQVREEYGPEAIIGVEVGIASAALPLQHLDIDYVSFPADMSLSTVGENVEALRNAEFTLPIVAAGEYDAEMIALAKTLGINGVAVSSIIADAYDPIAATAELLKAAE